MLVLGVIHPGHGQLHSKDGSVAHVTKDQGPNRGGGHQQTGEYLRMVSDNQIQHYAELYEKTGVRQAEQC